MTTQKNRASLPILALLALSVLNLQLSTAFAQGTAFTYQGRLNVSGAPASGSYDFRFRLAADPLGNNYVASPFFTNGIPVTNGLFTTTLDFGADIFTGSNYWLEVDVRTNGAGSYTVLTPLQPLTPAPYSVFANTASNLSGTLSSGQISGPVPSANISGTYGNAVVLNNSANQLTGAFTGNGLYVSNVNALFFNGLAPSNFWQLGGNNVASGQFIGSTNNQPVEIWANGLRALRLEPNSSGAPNIIEGSPVNFISVGVGGATIGGGGATNYGGLRYSNSVTGDFGTVSGGYANTAGLLATIGGGDFNNAGSEGNTVGGGEYNTASGSESTVSGGYANNASGNYATVGGGTENVVNGEGATAAGGENNNASSFDATVSGGYGNTASARNATVGGGNGNQANNNNSTVPGGQFNLAGGQYSFAAGQRAKATNDGSFVWADTQNADFPSTNNNSFNVRANGGARFVTGGAGMMIDDQSVLTTGSNSTGISIQQNSSGAPNIIEGSPVNFVSPGVRAATIGGGGAANYGGLRYSNSVTGDFGTVSGGYANTAGLLATIGGGDFNNAGSEGNTVGGGEYNTASGSESTVSGGYANNASGNYATVGGGTENVVNGEGATAAGGENNNASSFDATVSGGYGNTASALNATVGGGNDNRANNKNSTVPGGQLNLAGGQFSFAAGQRAKAINDGSFVWADSQAADFSSTTNNEFNIRAQNGVRIQTDKGIHLNAADNPIIVRDWDPFSTNAAANNPAKVGIGRWGLFMEPTMLTIGIPSNDAGSRFFQIVKYSTNGTYTTLVKVDQAGNITNSGTITANGVLLTSDRNAKENFTPLEQKAVLEKVAAMPVTQWNYKDDTGAKKHIGPMAQDFHAAFGLNGEDDTHISMIDESGVALAAIQGLNQKLEDQAQKLKTRDAEIQELRQSIAELKTMLSKSERTKANTP